MLILILILVVLAVCGVLGFVIKGLLWLGIIAIALMVVSAAIGVVSGRRSLRR